MLTLHPYPDRLRSANNIIPTRNGMASRPGAAQIIAGNIDAALPWGNRLLIEKQGRIGLWDGGTKEIDIAPAGRALQATAFQALTLDAKREDRLCVADGINPLWYIARRSGAYARYDIVNKVKDSEGKPYPVPVAQAVATWRGRAWAAFGTNRVRHCQFDDMEHWDPLWTVECQGDKPDRIIALKPDGERLLVGLFRSAWAIAGDSQYNWQRNQIAPYGVAGPNAIASDDQRSYWVSPHGLHQGGTAEMLSEDIREMFAASQYPAELVIDGRRSLLLLLVGGRLFVMHLDRPGKFGEITGHKVRGIIEMAGYVGWYGSDGAWVLAERDTPDRRIDGSATSFTSLYSTWEDVPNSDGGGTALLTRTIAVVLGSARGNATYTVTAESKDGSQTFSDTASLADATPQKWTDKIAGLNGEDWPTPPVLREFAPYLSGTRFRHEISAPCHMEVREFKPNYRFGGDA